MWSLSAFFSTIVIRPNSFFSFFSRQFQVAGKMAHLVHTIIDNYRDLMDNKSGKYELFEIK